MNKQQTLEQEEEGTRWMVFTTTQKVTKHLGYFCIKICSQEIPKIAQSGHTVHDVRRRRSSGALKSLARAPDVT